MLLGKKHDVAQSDIVYAILRKSLGIMPKKLKGGLRTCRLKMGGVTSCDIKQSKNLFVAKL